jgi:conjugal transfer pilus assembly protein TraK
MPAQPGLVPTPSVPASAVPRLPPPPPTAAQQALINTGLASATIRPGEAQIFPVSAGRVNRIVTPFVHAKVSSEAVGGIDVRGGVIYVTPASDGPISMFVTEDGDESVALNVTLVPSRIPPVHLELHLPADIVAQMASRQPVDRSLAQRFERGQPFVEMLRDLLRTLALGRVPAGFELRETIPPETTTPRCLAGPARVEFSRGQYLLGASVEVLIGVVSNPGTVGVDFTESWCGSPGVIAVALSPAPFLAPGGAAEIYIVRRLAAADDDRQPVRPTLVGGGG